MKAKSSASEMAREFELEEELADTEAAESMDVFRRGCIDWEECSEEEEGEVVTSTARDWVSKGDVDCALGKSPYA